MTASWARMVQLSRDRPMVLCVALVTVLIASCTVVRVVNTSGEKLTECQLSSHQTQVRSGSNDLLL